MPRQIITKTAAITVQANTNQEDPYVNKLLKLIPADIIAVYLTVFNLIQAYQRSDGGTNGTFQWIVFAAILVITPFYLRLIAKVESVLQIIFCVISFCIWVFSIGGPGTGKEIGGYSIQFIASILLPIYTLFIPFVYEKATK
ncbi:MAG: hypothetical protein J7502_01265 [Flavisolibacter sp.]|nr:hypothetical protein [Flavisolibacter sp.]